MELTMTSNPGTAALQALRRPIDGVKPPPITSTDVVSQGLHVAVPT